MDSAFLLVPDGEQLLVGGFNITRNLELMKHHWWNQSTVSAGHNREEAKPITSDILGGKIFCLRVQRQQPQLLATVEVRTPMGLYYSEKQGSLFTASDHWIMEVKNGSIVKSLSNTFFNCLHGICPSMRKDVEAVFVASTGIDAILEINLTKPEQCLWEWFATENGYDRSANSLRRKIDRGLVHQGVEYWTHDHTTHLNSVLQLDEKTLLSTLFHQGQLIEIDLNSKSSRVVLDRLRQPHGIHRVRDGGFMVCDTNGKRIIILNQFFQICGEINGDFDWVQDARELSDDSIIIADSNNHRLLSINHSGEYLWEWKYGTDKRIGCLLPLSARACKKIFDSAAKFH